MPKRLSLDEVNNRLLDKNIKLLSEYTKTTNSHNLKCLKCGCIWKNRLQNIFSYNQGCPKCFSESTRKTDIEFKKELNSKQPHLINTQDKYARIYYW